MAKDKPERIDDRHDLDDTAAAAGGAEAVFMFSRDAVRHVDAEAGTTYAMPSIVLMENAARDLAQATLDLLDEIDGNRLLILAGPGNNGGDGFALARHLSNARCEVIVALTHPREKYQGDAATNLTIVDKMGLAIVELDAGDPAASLDALPDVDLMVDALLGTGLDRPLRSPIREVVGWINRRREAERRLRVVAVDIPTGLDCDTGEVLGEAVVADLTVTFVGLKRGFFELAAQQYVGDVYIGDIGVPYELKEKFGDEVLLGDRHDHDEDEDEDEAPVRPHDPEE